MKILMNITQIKKRKIVIVFGDMIADILSNKEPQPVVTKLFIRSRKINISFGFFCTILFYCTKKYQTNWTYKLEHNLKKLIPRKAEI